MKLLEQNKCVLRQELRSLDFDSVRPKGRSSKGPIEVTKILRNDAIKSIKAARYVNFIKLNMTPKMEKTRFENIQLVELVKTLQQALT